MSVDDWRYKYQRCVEKLWAKKNKKSVCVGSRKQIMKIVLTGLKAHRLTIDCSNTDFVVLSFAGGLEPFPESTEQERRAEN